MGALLVSPFNVKWRCYVPVGGVEESKFCLFSVVFLVRCISTISPRFYFRRDAFCFLPLAAILESSICLIIEGNLNYVMKVVYSMFLYFSYFCNFVIKKQIGGDTWRLCQFLIKLWPVFFATTWISYYYDKIFLLRHSFYNILICSYPLFCMN
jgi:hypothetical protein